MPKNVLKNNRLKSKALNNIVKLSVKVPLLYKKCKHSQKNTKCKINL